MRTIKAAVFDLDNCLGAADEAGRKLLEPAFAAIREANDGTVPDAVLSVAFDDMWRHGLDWVARAHGFTPAMREAGVRTMAGIEVAAPLTGYGDLGALEEVRVPRFLVTTGFRRLQESKVRALGIGALFAEVIVDALDDPDRCGKEAIFAGLMKRLDIHPAEFLVVGDNEESELAAGERLGMTTVQTLRPGVPRSGRAMFHIRSLVELPGVIEAAGRGREDA